MRASEWRRLNGLRRGESEAVRCARRNPAPPSPTRDSQQSNPLPRGRPRARQMPGFQRVVPRSEPRRALYRGSIDKCCCVVIAMHPYVSARLWPKERPAITAVRRAGSADPAGLAEHRITALHHIATTVPEVRDAGKVRTERCRRSADHSAAAEGVAPGIRRRST